MEEVGWFSGPRVKLKNRTITAEYILQMISKHSAEALRNLVDAYDNRPEGLSAQAQTELFEAIERITELPQTIRSISRG